MANILYYTRPDFIYDEHSGGMGTKTRSILEAWSDGGLHTITCTSNLSKITEGGAWTLSESADGDIKETQTEKYDVVIIELLQIHNLKTWSSDMELLTNFSGAVLVYGSDSELLRMPGKLVTELKQHVDLWVPNCEWQANYFRDYDLPVASVLHEPIDTDLFVPSENTEKIIVAGGMTSYGKQTDFFIELFEKLKAVKGDYQTAYIGSAAGWGKKKYLPENLELQRELEKQTDIFHGQLRPTKVARAMSAAAVGVLNPLYETCNRIHMELMACGKPMACGVHILYDERPVTKRFATLDECIEVLSELTAGFTALPDKSLGDKARKHAETYFSYEATCKQFNDILRRVL